MAETARVTSIDALRDLRAALCDFALESREALCATELEIRHTLDWLHDQAKYWQRQVRLRGEELVRAKAELYRRKHSDADRRGTTEPEIVYEKARRRLAEAETKLENTRRWAAALPQAIAEYEGPARQLGGMLEADLSRGLALLDRKVEALEAYVATTTGQPAEELPGGSPATEPPTAGDGPR